MKIPLYLSALALCCAVAIGACNEGPTNVADEAALSSSQESTVATKGPKEKTDICHYDASLNEGAGALVHLNVNGNAWDGGGAGCGGKENGHGKQTGHNGHEMDTNFNSDTAFVATDCEAFCYEDRDGDGLTDDVDPCIFDPDNDSDGDGVCFSEGDTCYADPADSDGGTDTDGDGWCDDNDNCVDDPNDQANADGDDFGDVCDNCPDDVNNGQEDVDADGIGDACDECTDVDGDGYGQGLDAEICDPDCDDDDPAVNPGATEVCNNVDDNCSGTVDDDGACDAQACSTPTTFGSLGPCDDTVSCPGTDAFCYNRLTGSTQGTATGICAFELTSGDCTGLTVCTGVGDSACAADEVCIARGCAATGWACVPVSELCPDPTAS